MQEIWQGQEDHPESAGAESQQKISYIPPQRGLRIGAINSTIRTVPVPLRCSYLDFEDRAIGSNSVGKFQNAR